MIIDNIKKEYRRTKSIKATARNLNVCHSTVRKVLITAQMYTNPKIERIAELAALGMPDKDIGELLGMSSNAVNANRAYSRKSYIDQNKSINAVNIKKCRDRKKEAQNEG